MKENAHYQDAKMSHSKRVLLNFLQNNEALDNKTLPSGANQYPLNQAEFDYLFQQGLRDFSHLCVPENLDEKYLSPEIMSSLTLDGCRLNLKGAIAYIQTHKIIKLDLSGYDLSQLDELKTKDLEDATLTGAKLPPSMFGHYFQSAKKPVDIDLSNTNPSLSLLLKAEHGIADVAGLPEAVRATLNCIRRYPKCSNTSLPLTGLSAFKEINGSQKLSLDQFVTLYTLGMRNFSGMDLSGFEAYRDARLPDKTFSECQLHHAKLSEHDMARYLRDTRKVEIDFGGSNLLREEIIVDGMRISLNNLDFRRANFVNAGLPNQFPDKTKLPPGWQDFKGYFLYTDLNDSDNKNRLYKMIRRNQGSTPKIYPHELRGCINSEVSSPQQIVETIFSKNSETKREQSHYCQALKFFAIWTNDREMFEYIESVVIKKRRFLTSSPQTHFFASPNTQHTQNNGHNNPSTKAL
jgi:uncharacterized protein YjbI with pentapeptide repeats